MTAERNGGTSLALMSEASRMLAEASTIQQAKELKDLALTAADWARRKGMGEEAIQYARSYAIRAERKMGEMLAATERAKGGQPYQKSTGNVGEPVDILTLADLGISKRESSDAQFLATLPEEEFEGVVAGEITLSEAKRETKRAESKAKLESIETKQAKELEGVYDVVVIDPPWPMQKIERDVRPNQTLMDYPVMEEDELTALDIPAAEDCHLWLWTTHRFLPMAFRLLEAWEFKYVCAFVWHKPGGFQPVGLPQYNCEFSLYARKGSPIFTETTAFPVCFEAPRGAHSEKPEGFYEVVRRVTGGRRLDMFNRRSIEGFDTWGQEAK